jgi:hypothetical protein
MGQASPREKGRLDKRNRHMAGRPQQGANYGLSSSWVNGVQKLILKNTSIYLLGPRVESVRPRSTKG